MVLCVNGQNPSGRRLRARQKRENRRVYAALQTGQQRENCVIKREWYLRNREPTIARSRAWMDRQLQKNPDEFRAKAAERQRKYRKGNERRLAARRAWREENREKIRAQARARRAKSPEKFRERTNRWRAKNKEQNAESWKTYRKRYYENNSADQRVAAQKRRAERVRASGSFTANDWRSLLKRSPACYYCGRKWSDKIRPTHDHVIPISRGGANSPENSVCACLECNVRKSDKLLDPITGQGLLL
jgi:5-methylcytosine-specific restriction endonuclease McrA